MASVTLDVGGKVFRTTTATLRTLPTTRLGRLAVQADHDQQKQLQVFFDRNPEMVNSLLGLYRTGRLHLPTSMCVSAAEEELKFWEVPTQLIMPCCWRRYHDYQSDEGVVAEINRFLQDPYAEFYQPAAAAAADMPLTWRMKLWLVLERPDYCLVAKIWTGVYFLFIFLSILSFAFETVQKFRTVSDSTHNAFFLNHAISRNITSLPQGFDISSLKGMGKEFRPAETIAITVPDNWLLHLRYLTFCFFVADFIIRLIACPSRKRFFCQARNWLEMAIAAQSVSFFAMENVVVPYIIERRAATVLEENGFICLLALSGLRACRIFYLAKNFDNMKILVLCAKSSLRELLMLATCVLSFVTLFGTLAYMAEVISELTTFDSVPAAMWWAVVTMTTVGYGDVYPVSVSGQLVGSLCALCGVIVMALPIAVIASKFAAYHDNMAPQHQGKARHAFLQDHPDLDFNLDLDFNPHITVNAGEGEGNGKGEGLGVGEGDGGAGKLRREASGGKEGRRKARRVAWSPRNQVHVASHSQGVN